MGALKRFSLVVSATIPFLLFQYYLGAPNILKPGADWMNEDMERNNRSIRFMPCGSFAEHRLGEILFESVVQRLLGTLQCGEIYFCTVCQ